MNVFEKVSAEAKVLFSDWIKVGDPRNNLTIEDFEKSGVDQTKTNGHCWKCVTVNQCWFKNEIDKKPLHYDYGNYSFGDAPLSKRGLYHPYCHDKEYSINVPKQEQIIILKLRTNFNNFFKRKKAILYGIGYTDKDEKEIMDLYVNQVKTNFRYGNYYFYKHWEYGYQINIEITIVGKGTFKNKQHKFKSGLIIYPNGKLKIATIFAGRL